MRDQTSSTAIFAACCLISLGANAYMLAPASIVPLLVPAFAIDKATAGLAISAAILGSVIIQLPGGFLMDRYDNRRLMLAGTLLFAPAAVLGTVFSLYTMFLATRILAGIAAGGLFVLSANIVAEVFAGERQGFMTTLFLASAPLGFAVSQIAGPILGEQFGWQAPFIAYPALAVAGYLLFLTARPNSIRTGDPVSLEGFQFALRNRSVLLVSLAGFCSYMLYIFLNSWMPTYASEQLPITLGQAGTIAALLPAVGIVARPVGGWLSDRLGFRRRAIVFISLAFALPAFLIIPRAVSVQLFASVMLGVGFCLQFGMGVYYVYTRELASPGTGATSLTVFTTIAFLGTLIAPALGGWLIEAVTWGPTFVIHIGIGILGLGLLSMTPDSNPATAD
jgi:MFS family permease